MGQDTCRKATGIMEDIDERSGVRPGFGRFLNLFQCLLQVIEQIIFVFQAG
jgi:hypothetical protein